MPAYLTPHLDRIGADLRAHTLCVLERRVKDPGARQSRQALRRQDVSAGGEDGPAAPTASCHRVCRPRLTRPGQSRRPRRCRRWRGRARGPSGPLAGVSAGPEAVYVSGSCQRYIRRPCRGGAPRAGYRCARVRAPTVGRSRRATVAARGDHSRDLPSGRAISAPMTAVAPLSATEMALAVPVLHACFPEKEITSRELGRALKIRSSAAGASWGRWRHPPYRGSSGASARAAFRPPLRFVHAGSPGRVVRGPNAAAFRMRVAGRAWVALRRVPRAGGRCAGVRDWISGGLRLAGWRVVAGRQCVSPFLACELAAGHSAGVAFPRGRAGVSAVAASVGENGEQVVAVGRELGHDVDVLRAGERRADRSVRGEVPVGGPARPRLR